MGLGADGAGCRSTVRSAPSGRPTASAPASARATGSSEIVELRRQGFPVHRPRRRQLLSRDPDRSQDGGPARRPDLVSDSERHRSERFELMRRLAALLSDMVFFTQITMEPARIRSSWTPCKARIKGALVGIESVSPEGLKDVHKGFQRCRRRADRAVARLPRTRCARAGVVHLRAGERSRAHLRRDGRRCTAGRGSRLPSSLC